MTEPKQNKPSYLTVSLNQEDSANVEKLLAHYNSVSPVKVNKSALMKSIIEKLVRDLNL